MQECSALLDWSFFFATMQVLKLSKVHFVEDSVFLDLVLDLVMHFHHSTRSGSFCWGLELFFSSV